MSRDRNLLFGVLAVQLDKITPLQLAEAAEVWASDPSQPLHSHLLTRNLLSTKDSTLLQTLVEAAIRAHNGIDSDALASFGGEDQIRRCFSNVISLTPDGGFRYIPSTSSEIADSELGMLPAVEETPGRYTHISQYGHGGMGRVLLAHDQHLGRDIALKELLPSVSSDATTVMPNTPVRNLMPVVHRFLQEARITGQLEHPSIVPVYEMGRRRDGHLYYTMKLVRGMTLGKALHESTSLEKRLAYLPHYLDLCQAIAYAHARKVIHRDIKPDNVMIGDFGETVVIDWGLAKVIDKEDVHLGTLEETIRAMQIDDSPSPVKTHYGEALGTPVYMAPEQARGQLESVDERSDVYSLGAVLYELLTGALPLDGKTVKAILAQAANERPKPIRDHVSDAPPELIAICEKAMDSLPANRYANAKQLAEEIRRFQEGALVQAYAYRFSEHLNRFVRRHKTKLVTAAAGIAALIVVAAVSYVQVRQERDRAVVARNDAVAARNDAVVARDQEAQQREAAERQLYISCIFLARESVDSRRYDVAMQALERAPEQLRNWEWKFYYRLCHLDERTLAGHGNAVPWAEYSPNGKRILTASDDSTAKVWDVASGAVLCTLTGHTDPVEQAHFSSDGTKIVTCSYDKTAKIWDAASGNERVALTGHTDWVMTAEFSPDATRVVTASDDKTAKVWDAASGKEMFTLVGHTAGLRMARFYPDGRDIITVSADATAKVWDASTGQQVRSLSHGGAVMSASFTADGARMLTRAADNTVHIWDADSGENLIVIDGRDGKLCDATFSPDGTRIAAAFRAGYAKVFDAQTGAELLTLPGHQEGGMKARYSPDGANIVTASTDNSACLWDAESGSKLATLHGHSNAINAADFSPDAAHIVTASTDGTAKIWSVLHPATPEQRRLNGNAGDATALAVNRDGSRLITAYQSGSAKVWEPRTGRELLTLSGHSHNIVTAHFSADESRIVTSSSDTTAIVWDATTGQALLTLKGHTKQLTDAEFSPDGTRVVTASLDATAKLWDTTTGAELQTLIAHTEGVGSASFDPSGTKIVTSSGDLTARIWDAASGRELRVLSGHTRGLSAAIFSPDGRQVVTTSGDMTAKLWDVDSGKELATLRGHRNDVLGAVFSPNQEEIATRSSDGFVKIWSLDGQEILSLPAYHFDVSGLCFSPDGQRILTSSSTGAAKLWDVRSGAEMAALPLPPGAVRNGLFTSDGLTVITTSGDIAQVWNAS
ncbi:MAG: serine/threonine protein kinase [Candidatus Hydrogenedentes bacterium]|nr:serine/threonine protein kinase [Candidatus Hydrogenedentota bacterium]